MKAIWNDKIIADSNETINVEGNEYFPPESAYREYLHESDHHTTCPWKGKASYYHVSAGGEVNENAAWYYPNPSKAAEKIKDYVAFWKGVEVKGE